MVYSAIETTYFGLYWPSSGFYNVDEGSIKAIKTVRGLLIKRTLNQHPLTVFTSFIEPSSIL